MATATATFGEVRDLLRSGLPITYFLRFAQLTRLVQR